VIGKHCGKPLWRLTDNQWYFRKQCQVCKRVFKQHKRQPDQ
jgi:hypothetical protein